VPQVVDPSLLYPQHPLYVDYLRGREALSSFFTHPIHDVSPAYAARENFTYPRAKICDLLESYNAHLQAGPRVMENIAALRQSSTFCVMTGQQAGFLGGPMYACYKIITTIRLAKTLSTQLRMKVVPIFWLASDDHDFDEINRAHLLDREGNLTTVRFDWKKRGRPIEALPITREVIAAAKQYFSDLPPGPHRAASESQFLPEDEKDYATWHAHIWSRLFADQGLIIVEPKLLRQLARPFFNAALREEAAIEHRLHEVAAELQSAGYSPALSPKTSGRLFTLDDEGRRIRVEDPRKHLSSIESAPERYSTDAALRPLLADTLFPTLANVLGPGEFSYHAMLKPLYDLFNLPQPLLFPRKSYTLVSPEEAELIEQCNINLTELGTDAFEPQRIFHRLSSTRLKKRFARADRRITNAFEPLQAFLRRLDPSLERTWNQAKATSLHQLSRLRDRAIRVEMARKGISPSAMHRLRNALFPRDMPQERVFPLPYFTTQHGFGWLNQLFSLGELTDFSHHVYTLEDDHA